MRVLLLNQTYLPDPVATSQYLGRWAEHLARAGHEVTVLASRRAYHDPQTRHAAREKRAGVNVVRVAGGGGKSRAQRVLGFATFLLGMAMRALLLPKPDVIVALTSPPLLPVVATFLARLRGVRLLVWAMDLHPEAAIAAGLLREDSVAARLARTLSRWSLRVADRVVVLDGHMRRRLLAQGVPAANVRVVPLWMQADIRFDPIGRAQVRRTRGWESKFVVMCAGNHGACHSMATMVAAAETLRDEPRIHFCWVGGGAQRAMLRERAAPNVSLLGYVPREKLAALLSAADLQVAVMGDAFVGLLHPCKIYNILAVERPILYVGPEEGPLPDVMRAAGLDQSGASCRHGNVEAVTREIRRRARERAPSPAGDLASWQELRCLEELTSALGYGGRFPQSADAPSRSPVFAPDVSGGMVVHASGGTGAGHRR